MDAQRYVYEVMESHILPYLQQLEDPLFKQNKVRCYITRASLNLFEEAHINILPWLPRSSDLLSVERVWSIVGRKLHCRDTTP
ncbi:hypothetical protein Trydic_g22354 [Trypoxylus dichotomus]